MGTAIKFIGFNPIEPNRTPHSLITWRSAIAILEACSRAFRVRHRERTAPRKCKFRDVAFFLHCFSVLVDLAIFERYAGATKPTQLNEFECHTDFLGTKRLVGVLGDHFLR